MEKLYWRIKSELQKEADDNYRTNYALKLKDKEPLQIIRELTFDGVVPDVTVKDIENMFDFVESKFLKRKISGVGLEVGSGPGTFSSILAGRKNVEKVYGVEVCRPIVETLMPKISGYIFNGQTDKVIGVVGSFDEMELPDESVDFIFDFFSLHHSNDLAITLKECRRILKKDGFVFCFDKARPDHYEKQDLDELLDTEYGEDYKKRFGLPLGQKLTRRMNGEREYRLKDWQEFLKGAGFSRMDYFYLNKTNGGGFLAVLIKKIISLLSIRVQLFVDEYLPEKRYDHKFGLEVKNRIYTKFLNPFRKEISLVIAYK